MHLIDILRADQLQARKSRQSHADDVRASLLTTLLGEAVAVGKNKGNRASTNEEVLGVIGKFLKSARETVQRLRDAGQDDADFQQEIDVLETYLREHSPKQLSEQELEAVVRAIATDLGASSVKDMGRVMAALKVAHAGAFDGAVASAVVKRVLA
jgi:uncharacterized protein YqeY